MQVKFFNLYYLRMILICLVQLNIRFPSPALISILSKIENKIKNSRINMCNQFVVIHSLIHSVSNTTTRVNDPPPEEINP